MKNSILFTGQIKDVRVSNLTYDPLQTQATTNNGIIQVTPAPTRRTMQFNVKTTLRDSITTTFGPYEVTTMCGPDSTTITDTIEKDLVIVLKTEDTINNYWEFDEFNSSFADCNITSYALQDSPQGLTLTN